MTPDEQALQFARWQGQVEGKLTAQGETIAEVKSSMDRVESKVNKVINRQENQSGTWSASTKVVAYGASGALIVFAAFVGKVFS